MDLSHPSSIFIPVAVTALVAWRLYSRVRRMVGRQRLSPARPWITVILFPLLLALIAAGGIAQGTWPLAMAGGVVAGVLLGLYGLRLTRFDATPEGLFYTPNAHLGVALSLLLIARIGYRAVQIYLQHGTAPPGDPAATMMQSPLTLAIFGTLAGYYVAYAIGLLRWKARAGAQAGAAATHPPIH